MNNIEKQWTNSLKQIQNMQNKNTIASRVKMRKLIKNDQRKIFNFETKNPLLKNTARSLLRKHAKDIDTLNYSLKLKNMKSVKTLIQAYLPWVPLNKACFGARAVGRFVGVFMKNEARIIQDLSDVILHSFCNGSEEYINQFINKMKCDCAGGNCYVGTNASCSPSKNNRSQKIHIYYKSLIHILNTYVQKGIFNKRRFIKSQKENYKNIYISNEARLSFASGIITLYKIKNANQQMKILHALLKILSKYAQYKDESFLQFVQLIKPEIKDIESASPYALKSLLQIGMGSAGFQYRNTYMIIFRGMLKPYLAQSIV
jgi:hypothetical protein